MKHLTVESKDLLIGDDAADALTEYAALIAARSLRDRVDVHAISSDGDEVVATIVLSGGTTILVETSHNQLPEPDNTEVIAYMRQRISLITDPPPTRAEPTQDEQTWDAELGEL